MIPAPRYGRDHARSGWSQVMMDFVFLYPALVSLVVWSSDSDVVPIPISTVPVLFSAQT